MGCDAVAEAACACEAVPEAEGIQLGNAGAVCCGVDMCVPGDLAALQTCLLGCHVLPNCCCWSA